VCHAQSSGHHSQSTPIMRCEYSRWADSHPLNGPYKDGISPFSPSTSPSRSPAPPPRRADPSEPTIPPDSMQPFSSGHPPATSQLPVTHPASDDKPPPTMVDHSCTSRQRRHAESGYNQGTLNRITGDHKTIVFPQGNGGRRARYYSAGI